MFGCQRLAETSMMRPSCQDPGGSRRLQVGLRPPHSPGDRKPGQGLMRRYHLYCIDEHAEAITHIHYRSIDGRPRPGIKHQSEEHTSELQSRLHLVCRLLLEKKK